MKLAFARLWPIALSIVACSEPSSSGESIDESTDESTDKSTDESEESEESGSEGELEPSSSCKRGLAYGHHSDADLAALGGAVAWWYNWAYQPDAELSEGAHEALGVEYVPMIWGGSFDVDAATAGIPPRATTLLGFNEPNFGEQSNLSAAEAAALWPDVEQIADARGLTLVSPAVNYCGGDCQDTDPFNYLDEFFAACDGCRVDHVAFHIYVGCHPEGDNKAQWLIDHVESYKARFAQPLWLSEFACTDAANFDEQIAFLEDAVEYLENDAAIERYAWFSGRFEGIPYIDLFAGDGQLTALGRGLRERADQPRVWRMTVSTRLVDKATLEEAPAGATASPDAGPGAAFRRPSAGYRYFLIHLDVATRTVQLAIVHPEAVPSEIAPLLPNLPASVSQATIDSLLALRLPS